MMRAYGDSLMDASNAFSMEITTDGQPKFEWRVSRLNKVVFVVDSVDVRTGGWIYLAFVRDTVNNKVICYVNGTEVASVTVKASQIADINYEFPVMIGSDYTDDDVLAYGYTPDFKYE